ncbi:unnamed protein product [Cunninghamella echinulata]
MSIHDADAVFGLEYTNSVITTALKSCISGLLKLHGFNWLLEYPRHFSSLTWSTLQAKMNRSLLIHLYGLTLGLKKQDTVPTITWGKAMLQFLRAGVAPLSCHIWLNFCYLDQQQQQFDTPVGGKTTNKNSLKDLFLTSHYHKQNELVDILRVLHKGNTTDLVNNFENHLGSALLRDSFTHDEMILAMMSFEICVKTKPVLYSEAAQALYIFHHQKFTNEKDVPKVIQPNYANPLSPKSLLRDVSSDFPGRSKEIEKGIQLWLQQIAKLLPSDFDMYLKELILNNYPSEKKRILDMVIVEWAIFDPFGCHMEIIMEAMVQLIQSSNYIKRSAPYYAWIQSFNLSNGEEEDYTTKSIGYNIKTGAEINISRFNTKHDLAKVNGLEKILQRLTRVSSSSSASGIKSWIEDCLRVSSSDIIEQHIVWLTQQLNEEIENISSHHHSNSNTPFMSHLQVALMNPRVTSFAPFIVPTLLYNASDQLLAWLVRRKTEKVTTTASGAGKILIEYFSEGNQLSSKILITDLLRSRSKEYIDYLVGYLRENMQSTNPVAKNSRLWFSHHFLMPLLLEAGNELIIKKEPQEQGEKENKNVSLLCYQQFLNSPEDFGWFFRTPCTNDMNATLVANKLTWIGSYHLILPIRHIGLESLLQCMVQLETSKQQQLVDIWKNLWIPKQISLNENDSNNDTTNKSSTAMNTNTCDENDNDDKYRRRFNVPIDWVLQCIGLYDQAPAIVKQMMELFISIGIRSRIQQNEIVVDTIGKAETFTQQIMDLLLLSDAPEVDELFDLYLRLCQDMEATRQLDEDDMIRSIANILISLTEELKLRNRSNTEGTAAMDIDDHNHSKGNEEVEGEDDNNSNHNKGNTTDTDNENMKHLNTAITKTKRKLRRHRRMEKYQRRQNKRLNGNNNNHYNNNGGHKKKQKKLQQLLQHKKDEQLQVINDLFILIQRVLNFLLAILSGSDENSLCPIARQRVRNNLIHYFTLYEPLANLKRMDILPAAIQDDLQLIIDVCLELLSKNDSKLYNIIKNIFAS